MNDFTQVSPESGWLENITYEEMQIGQFATLQRTLTKLDIALFARVSGDVNPAHLDEEYALHDRFHGVIGHGMWTAALISTVLGTRLPGPGTVYLNQDVRFTKPVRIGDTVTVKLTVDEKPDDHKPMVIFQCEGVNQNGEVIMQGKARVLAPVEKIRRRAPALPDVALQNHDRFERLLQRARAYPPVRTAVVHPVKANVLEASFEAAREKLIEPVLVGPRQRIEQAAREANIDISAWPLIDTEHSHEAAAEAVKMAASGDVEAIMKGSLHTDELLSAVLSSPVRLRTERRISHVYVMDVPTYPKSLFITDAAINIAPDLAVKADIIQNAINLWHVVYGESRLPKVAILAAVETVNPRMPATLDAAALCKMSDRGQITGGLLDGPLAFDNAISPEAVADKGIISNVAGDADILVAPDIEAGNMLAKQLSFLSNADAAGIVIGARVPIILTSRADSRQTRLMSCALAVLMAAGRREGRFK
jgi:phosphate acetyltransferase